MATPHTGYIYLDLGVKQDVAHEIADGDVVIVCVPVPVNGTIVGIWVCADVLPDAGSLTVQNGGQADYNIIASLDLTSLTANTGTSQTLLEGVEIKATEMLRGTWTLTTIGSGVGFGCLVVIEPAVS